MLGELGIIATLLQWLHGIRSGRAATEKQATIDSYLEWLRRHNHEQLLKSILESKDAVDKLDQFIHNNHATLLDIGDRILDAVTDGHGDLKEQLEDIQSSLKNLPTKREMQDMLNDLAETIRSDYVERQQAVPSRDILRYKVLGNRLAEFKAQVHVPDVLDAKGHITSDLILDLHKNLFPEGFAWAGALRTQPVYIAEFFGTAARAVDLVESRVDSALTAPEAIPDTLNQLCERWNARVTEMCEAEGMTRVIHLAQFHYDFAIIHPFLDGNGRVGRLILDQQASFIFRQPLHLQIDREQYYNALRLGNVGVLDELRDLILAAIEKSMTSLDTE